MPKDMVFNINNYGVGMGAITTGIENDPQLNFNENWMVENFFPIGTIHLTTDETNPSSYFGGIWESFGRGRTLVCVDKDDGTGNFNSPLIKKGEKTHVLTIDEMPNHRHQHASPTGQFDSGSSVDRPYSYADSGGHWGSNYSGNSEPHNNLQPYITCYMWIRVA